MSNNGGMSVSSSGAAAQTLTFRTKENTDSLQDDHKHTYTRETVTPILQGPTPIPTAPISVLASYEPLPPVGSSVSTTPLETGTGLPRSSSGVSTPIVPVTTNTLGASEVIITPLQIDPPKPKTSSQESSGFNNFFSSPSSAPVGPVAEEDIEQQIRLEAQEFADAVYATKGSYDPANQAYDACMASGGPPLIISDDPNIRKAQQAADKAMLAVFRDKIPDAQSMTRSKAIWLFRKAVARGYDKTQRAQAIAQGEALGITHMRTICDEAHEAYTRAYAADRGESVSTTTYIARMERTQAAPADVGRAVKGHGWKGVMIAVAALSIALLALGIWRASVDRDWMGMGVGEGLGLMLVGVLYMLVCPDHKKKAITLLVLAVLGALGYGLLQAKVFAVPGLSAPFLSHGNGLLAGTMMTMGLLGGLSALFDYQKSQDDATKEARRSQVPPVWPLPQDYNVPPQAPRNKRVAPPALRSIVRRSHPPLYATQKIRQERIDDLNVMIGVIGVLAAVICIIGIAKTLSADDLTGSLAGVAVGFVLGASLWAYLDGKKKISLALLILNVLGLVLYASLFTTSFQAYSGGIVGGAVTTFGAVGLMYAYCQWEEKEKLERRIAISARAPRREIFFSKKAKIQDVVDALISESSNAPTQRERAAQFDENLAWDHEKEQPWRWRGQ